MRSALILRFLKKCRNENIPSENPHRSDFDLSTTNVFDATVWFQFEITLILLSTLKQDMQI